MKILIFQITVVTVYRISSYRDSIKFKDSTTKYSSIPFKQKKIYEIWMENKGVLIVSS